MVYGVGFHWTLVLLPVALFVAILFGTVMGLLITPLGLLYKDIGKLITFGMQFLMYATPVVYAIPKEGIMKTVMTWNPITPIVLTTRDLIVGFHPEYINYFIIVTLICLPLLAIGLVFYRIAIPVIVERISA